MTTYPAQDVILEYKNTGINRYPVTFEYDDVEQVQVLVFNPLTNEYDTTLVRGTDYVFDGPITIVFTGTTPDDFRILRATDISKPYGTKRFSKFAQGNAIRASDLNGNFELLRQAIQETQSESGGNEGDISALETRMDQAESDIDDLETDVNSLKSSKVNSVTATAPVESTGGLDPVISMPPASSSQDGYMSKEDKAKLDQAGPGGDFYEITAYPEVKMKFPLDADKGLQLPDETSASTYNEQAALRYNTGTERIEVHTGTDWQGVAGGAEIQSGPPSPASPGDLWWDNEEGRGYVYYDDGDSKQWVESNPSWNGSIPDGSVTPAKLSTGGPSWNTSGDLTVDGKATFEGDVKGNMFTTRNSSANDTSLSLGHTGAGYFFVMGDGTTYIGQNSRDVPANRVVTINGSDGSATFADGNTTISSADNSIIFKTGSNTGTDFSVFANTTDSKVSLGTGSESLNFGVKGTNYFTLDKNGTAEFNKTNYGSLFINQKISGTKYAIYCQEIGGSNEAWYVMSSGYGTFRGGLNAGGGQFTNTVLNATNQSTTKPVVSLNVLTTSSTAEFLRGASYNGSTGTTTCQLFGNGSAYFAGDIDANNVTFRLEPDNPAYYTTTTSVTTDPETGEETTVENRVYNGPTLDVKDRLQNLISRMNALEADEIIDDSNSSALLQLVHNLSHRLDLRDQQIADLTDRIQTLELQ